MTPIEVKPGIFLHKLTPENNVSDFDCGDEDINDFLKEDSLDHHKEDLAVVYLLKNREGEILGYMSLSMSAIKLEDPGVPYRYPGLPSLLIGRLGDDKKVQCKGYGILLISIAISFALSLKKMIGCRFVTADSYPDLAEFYKKNGFETEYSEETIRQFKERGRNIPMYFRLPRLSPLEDNSSAKN